MLNIENLTLQKNNKTLCENLNFVIKAGEIWGILGQNGCGKTTLLHTLGGLLPAHGNIFLQGQSLHTLPRKKIAQKIGLLLQNTEDRFPQTVFEYCLHGRYPHLPYFGYESKKDRDLIHQVLTTMELETFVHRNIQSLSGGERKRLSIATLLAQSPSLYLLDEPTNHLDLNHQMKTFRYFHTLTRTQSISVCVSLHDINLAAQFCDNLLLFTPEKPLVGKTEALLTEKNLSQLYQAPFTKRLGFYPY